jgi:hypothetical protein
MIIGSPYCGVFGGFPQPAGGGRGIIERSIPLYLLADHTATLKLTAEIDETDTAYCRHYLSTDNGLNWGAIQRDIDVPLALQSERPVFVRVQTELLATEGSPVIHRLCYAITCTPNPRIKDTSTLGCDITQGSWVRVHGYKGKAVRQIGLNPDDRITLPAQNMNVPHTLSFWMFIDDGAYYIAGDCEVCGKGALPHGTISRGGIAFADLPQSGSPEQKVVYVPSGVWTHIVIATRGAGSLLSREIWVNGILCASTSTRQWSAESVPIQFHAPGERIGPALDCIALHNRALTAYEITSTYQAESLLPGSIVAKSIASHSGQFGQVNANQLYCTDGSIKASRIEHFPRQIPDTIVDVAPPQHPGLEQITADFMVHFPCTIMLRSLSPGIDFRNTVIQGFPESGPETYHAGTHSELYTLMPGRYRLKHRTGVRMLVSGVFGTQNTAECITLL